MPCELEGRSPVSTTDANTASTSTAHVSTAEQKSTSSGVQSIGKQNNKKRIATIFLKNRGCDNKVNTQERTKIKDPVQNKKTANRKSTKVKRK